MAEKFVFEKAMKRLEEIVAALEKGGQPTRRVAYYAPVSGILSEVTDA